MLLVCYFAFFLALYLHKDGLGLSAVFATTLFTEVGVQDLIGWNSGISYPLLPSQHPDNHIWHAVLRLMTINNTLC